MTENRLYEALDDLYGQVREEAITNSRRKIQTALNQHLAWYDGVIWNPVGQVWFVMDSDGLIQVEMGTMTETEFVAHTESQLKKILIRNPEHTDGVKAQLQAYFAGKRQTFDIDIKWTVFSDFQRLVLRRAMQIPAGQVMSYGELAQAIGRPKAARAVGRALGANPMPIIIPCHRVLAASGALTGYSGAGGVDTKARLLALEGYQRIQKTG